MAKTKSKTEDFVMDASALLNDFSSDSSSFLDDIGVTVGENEVQDFRAAKESFSATNDYFDSFLSENQDPFASISKEPTSSNTTSSLTEAQIRQIFREELSSFLKDKTILKESKDNQVIYFKVGNSLFKGNMTLVKTN